MTSTWKPYLQRQARLHRMCDDNRAYLSACETKEDAVRLYKQTIDWALEAGYPDLDFLRKEFGNMQGVGLFIDQHFTGQPFTEHQVYIFHNCTGTIRVGINIAKKMIPMCYFANGCDMTILGTENERMFPDRVPLYVFGDNRVNAQSTMDVEFRIFNHKTKEGGKQ